MISLICFVKNMMGRSVLWNSNLLVEPAEHSRQGLSQHQEFLQNSVNLKSGVFLHPRYASWRLMIRLFVLLILFPILAHGETDTLDYKDAFRWAYIDFIQALSSNNWDRISELETKLTKCGFGPGEEGDGCIKRVIESNNKCLEDMLFSLKQGCKIKQSGINVSCISPPQFTDEAILISGARASFSFNQNANKLIVDSFICGGD